MKLSVSLNEADVESLDRYVAEQGLPSRSAGVQQAIRLLHERELGDAYAQAWDEWDASGEAAAWETTVADGLTGPDEHLATRGTSDAAR